MICCVALDVLGSEQSSLIPLFQTLPRKNYYGGKHNGVYVISGEHLSPLMRRVRACVHSASRLDQHASLRQKIQIGLFQYHALDKFWQRAQGHCS